MEFLLLTPGSCRGVCAKQATDGMGGGGYAFAYTILPPQMVQ